ncbi:MAG: class I SAM-dependent methyltransferase [Candidatus Acidiferrales bacterium]
MSDAGFDARIERLDITLFSSILSQTTDADKRSLLAIQACVRESAGEYVYLEIGSYLGGSIQPHLLDTKCRKIYSIDKRQLVSPDERTEAPGYPGNSEELMLSLLAALDPQKTTKIECIDGSTKSISPSRISDAPNLCFIDGEHTREAVVADFDFCRRVCAENATIVFHDSQIVFRGLRSVVSKLRREGRQFSTHALSDVVYVLCLDRSTIPARLAKLSSVTREDDLWSRRNDLRLLKWRALAFKARASNLGTRLLGRN